MLGGLAADLALADSRNPCGARCSDSVRGSQFGNACSGLGGSPEPGGLAPVLCGGLPFLLISLWVTPAVWDRQKPPQSQFVTQGSPRFPDGSSDCCSTAGPFRAELLQLLENCTHTLENR
jgi:hypothetical protein